MVIKCANCNAEIREDDISYWNSENEEGEEYGVANIECYVCKKEYEASQWGHIESIEEAKECYNQYVGHDK